MNILLDLSYSLEQEYFIIRLIDLLKATACLDILFNINESLLEFIIHEDASFIITDIHDEVVSKVDVNRVSKLLIVDYYEAKCIQRDS